MTKEEAIELLGLRGYGNFDKPGTLYVVVVNLEGEAGKKLLEKANPKVPLLYTVCNDDGMWNTADNFQENAFVGFTKVLHAELVIDTFQVEGVETVEELRKKGVTCIALSDEEEGNKRVRIS
ncbi:hypothetical protein ACHAXS_004787 [Conticribra weissflogii]